MAASAVGLTWLWVRSSPGAGLPWFIGSGGRHPAAAALATISGGLAIFHNMYKVRIEGNAGLPRLQQQSLLASKECFASPRVTTCEIVPRASWRQRSLRSARNDGGGIRPLG